MKAQTLLGYPDKFTSSEFTVLKSMALGLSCEDIRKLLGLKEQKYKSVCRELFEKLGVSNHYTAVKVAYQKNYLDRKELSLEALKSFSLEFAYKNVDKLKYNQQDPKQFLWELYDLLLDFHLQIENKYP
ncbi:MAG: hypothetical protein VW058_08820 [Flavobacteriaceae bacterium]